MHPTQEHLNCKVNLDGLKERDNRSTVIVGGFNTLLTSMDRSSRQKINKETAALHDTIDQMDLIDIFKALYPKAAEYIYFLSAHGIFSRIDYMLGYETGLNKFKRTEIIPSIFSDHNGMKLKMNHRNKKLKNTERHGG